MGMQVNQSLSKHVLSPSVCLPEDADPHRERKAGRTCHPCRSRRQRLTQVAQDRLSGSQLMRILQSLDGHLETQARAPEPMGPALPCPAYGLQFLDKSSCLPPTGPSAPAQKMLPESLREKKGPDEDKPGLGSCSQLLHSYDKCDQSESFLPTCATVESPRGKVEGL